MLIGFALITRFWNWRDRQMYCRQSPPTITLTKVLFVPGPCVRSLASTKVVQKLIAPLWTKLGRPEAPKNVLILVLSKM
mgnify:CR=1 FL=1